MRIPYSIVPIPYSPKQALHPSVFTQLSANYLHVRRSNLDKAVHPDTCLNVEALVLCACTGW